MKIFIVVTTLNEAKNIEATLQDLLNNGYRDIVVVDDGSKDDTIAMVRRFPVNLLIHRVNRGQGASLQTGHDYALQNGAQIVVDFDGDGQMQAKNISDIIQPIIDNQAEIVFGSRRNSDTRIPWIKKNLIHRPARVLSNFITGVELSDAHCGFRALGLQALQEIQITHDRMSHNTELVYLTKKFNLSYTEVPVEIIYKRFGQGFGGGLKVLRELFIDKLLK